ncbi:MAG: hypothetical protein K2H16_07630 [Prevotella sp.]|nr:hypothetical protein [Prevotella sp.]
MKETNTIALPDNMEVEKIENGKIYLKEKKQELPKTWAECFRKTDKMEYIDEYSDIFPILSVDDGSDSYKNSLPKGLGKPMLALCQLLICRDVYRKGWKPDWEGNNLKYIIYYGAGKVYTDSSYHESYILSFQSEEIRNIFYNNFKHLIEEAKELL